MKWSKEWFPTIPKYSPSYWLSESNQKRFLDEISSQFGIVKPSDWARITISLVKGQGGQVCLFHCNFNERDFSVDIITRCFKH